MRARVIGLAVLATVSLATACGGDGGSGATATPSVAAERPTSTAELTIERPRNGERVAGDVARLVVGLEGAELVDRTSTDLRPDEGHLHVTVDGVLVTMTSGREQTLTGLSRGDHLVQVEFVANDHAPFDPRVLAAVTFEAEG
jgi:hypothetical protein